MRLSLTQRLLLASSLVLTLFLGVAGWSVDRAAQQRARTALETRLLGQAYAMLGAAEENAGGQPRMPENLADPLFQQPESGMYAQVTGQQDAYIWQSRSMLGKELIISTDSQVGEPAFHENNNILSVDLLIEWESINDTVYLYRFTVAYDLRLHALEAVAFRSVLWWWLASAGLLLLVVQILLLRWGLQPLSALARDVADLQSGERQTLTRAVPEELLGLRDNLNSLVVHNRTLLERNRNRLADLAHSLKTPLAVLTGSVEEGDERQVYIHARQQLPRMRELVDYHLARASVSGGGLFGESTDIVAEVKVILSALKKVHRARAIAIKLDMPDQLLCKIDKGDFYELVGNLLDNAFKYCASKIHVEIVTTDTGLYLSVDDDGSGMSSEQYTVLTQRGMRADQHQPGQGIGLSIVQEVVAAYRGEIKLGGSKLGGSRFEVMLDC